MSRVQDRYRNDPRFRACVDSMRSILAENYIDAGSLMEAAVEALNQHYAEQSPHIYVITKKELANV